MLSSKKMTGKGTLRQQLICLRPSYFLSFCIGVVEQFLAGSESFFFFLLFYSLSGLNMTYITSFFIDFLSDTQKDTI